MAERKLRLAVPSKGWLVHPERWGVRDILRLAGIGEYYEGGKEIHFKSNDPGLRVFPVRPSDISNFLESGIVHFDLGITSRDLVEESRRSLVEVCDFKCGYVELVFASRPPKFTSGGVPKQEHNKLEMYLKELGSSAVCITRYPNIAHQFLSRNGLSGIVMGVRGASEKYLVSGLGDFILETIATGDAMRDYNLQILEKVLESSVRLYAPSYVNYGDNSWRREKILEIGTRVEDVVRDIDNYCQIRLLFRDSSVSYDYSKLEFNVLDKMDDEPVSIYYYPFEDYKSIPAWVIDRIFPKKNLSHVKEFILNMWRKKGVTFDDSPDKFLSFDGAVCYDLSKLYSYCPIYLATRKKVEMDDCHLEVFHLIGEYFKFGKYPCCEATALRPEHREAATLFSLGKVSLLNP